MRIRRRTYPLLGLILLLLAGVLVARGLGIIPEGLIDLIVRSWPALLILAGLAGLLRGRIPFSGLVALVASLALVAVVAATSFSSRAGQQRDDNRQPIAQALDADVTLLRVRVETLATEVEILGALTREGGVAGEFVGSAENQMLVNYEASPDGSATLTVRETQSSAFPRLETIGRGALRLELPPEVLLDVEFVGQDGTVILNMDGLSLERLNVNAARGDVLLTLPDHKPVLSTSGEGQGAINARSGAVTLFIPASVAARLELNREGSGIEPQYDPNVYNYLVGDVLEARGIESAETVVRYTITAPRGRIRVEVPS